MRIQHNIMAMNAYRNYNNNTSALSKNLEKLSSGYKINRAGDDAAGLAISEKMRAQITGLQAASKNVKDGVSLVKTAEGALQEVHDMLNRMDYLATQSANGTYDNEVDRLNLQKEVNSLRSEIDRIADSANFNGKKLLDGTMGGPKVTATDGVAAGAAATKASFTVDLTGAGAIENGKTYKLTIGTANVESGATGGTTAADLATAFATKKITIDTKEYTITADAGKLTFTAAEGAATAPADATTVTLAKGATTAPTGDPTGAFTTADAKNGTDAVAAQAAKTEIDFTGKTGADVLGGTVKIGDTTYQFVANEADAKAGNTAVVVAKDADADAIGAALLAKTNNTLAVGGVNYTVANTAGKFTLTETTPASAAGNLTKAPTATLAGIGLNLQIGDTSDDFNKLTVSVGDMHAKALGIADLTIADQTGAAEAIQKIKDAINSVSSTRGDLGAIQNRLEHTQNNLSVMTENIQDAEATIRDTDVADEMMAYTKNNILIQSAQAMLAQANQVPQGVLQLLQ